jgi:pentatricopeptide repeat protein
MKSLAEQIKETLIIEEKRHSNEKQLKEFEKLLSEMKKSGFIPTPNYTFPLVDTIGKTYYSSINKRD